MGATPGCTGLKVVSTISLLASPTMHCLNPPPQPQHLVPGWHHVLMNSTDESLYRRHRHRLKMGCILDYVAVMLVECPLSKKSPLGVATHWGGGDAIVLGCGCNDKQITPGRMQLITVCVAQLTVRTARLHCDPVFG